MKKILVAICFTFLFSCIQRNKGFYFSDINVVRNFDSYNFTKGDLIENIGEPSLEIAENVWLYYSYTYKNPLFQKNKIHNEKILLVYFDTNDKIVKHSFEEKKYVGNITDIKKEKKKNEGNIFKEFFKGLIVTPIGGNNVN
jgi:outer membrane protein assembly factor BamE (lipoprotein component of BamABCDE complex)